MEREGLGGSGGVVRDRTARGCGERLNKDGMHALNWNRDEERAKRGRKRYPTVIQNALLRLLRGEGRQGAGQDLAERGE